MTENKRYVRILDYSEKEVRIFDEHNQKNIFNIFFEGLDSAICLKGALEDTVDLLNYFYEEKKKLKEENEQLKQRINSRLHFYHELYDSTNDDIVKRVVEDLEDILKGDME